MANIIEEREAVSKLINSILESMEMIIPVINEQYEVAGINVQDEIAKYEDENSGYEEKIDTIINGVYRPEDIVAKEISLKIREFIENSEAGEDFVIKIEVYADGEKTK